MGAVLADMTREAGEVFARLLLAVSETVVTGDDVVAVRRLVDTAELVCTRMVATFAGETSFHDLGHRDVGSWLSSKTGARRGEGHARCAQAKLLDGLPLVNNAVLAGTFSASHARCLSAAVTPSRLKLAQRDERVFVDAAGLVDASLFARVVARWVASADDELCDPSHPGRGDDDTGFGQRRLQLTQSPDGSWRINGVLDPLAGEAVEAALVAATPNPSPQDARSPGQRRVDGFTDLCRWFLAQDDRGEVGGERPNVNVVFHLVDGSAHTSNGYFLRNWHLSQVMCDAMLTAVAASLKGTVLDVGSPLSVIPVRNRRAVVVRDRCCRMGGCSRSPRWCQIHHIRERENGGTHELDNLVLLCTYHHREVHRKGIVLHWEDVVLVATMPGGATLHGPPHPDTIPALF